MSSVQPACQYVKPQEPADSGDSFQPPFSFPNSPPSKPHENSQRMAPLSKALEALQKKGGQSGSDSSPKKIMIDQPENPCLKPVPPGRYPEIIPCI